MDLTKIKLQNSDITKFEFEDCINEKAGSSGFLRIEFKRTNEGDVNNKSLSMFFIGSITAFEGEETESLDDTAKVFCLKLEFTLKYTGEFDLDKLAEQVINNEWFFNKDASLVMNDTVNKFLSGTAYRSINLPYQQ